MAPGLSHLSLQVGWVDVVEVVELLHAVTKHTLFRILTVLRSTTFGNEHLFQLLEFKQMTLAI